MAAGRGFKETHDELVKLTKSAIDAKMAADAHADALDREANESAKYASIANKVNTLIKKQSRITREATNELNKSLGYTRGARIDPRLSDLYAGRSSKIRSTRTLSKEPLSSESFTMPAGWGYESAWQELSGKNLPARGGGIFHRTSQRGSDALTPRAGQAYGTKGAMPAMNRFQALSQSMSQSTGFLNKMNKSFFKFQMATLGLAFSFGGLEGTVLGAISAIGDLGGMFKGAAYGKAFTGIDMGVLGDPTKIVEGWKNFQGILGLVSATLGVITANMLTPDVLKAIENFFIALAPVLPQLGEALGKVLENAVLFLTDWVVPVIPLMAQLIDIFSPWLGILVPIILILGSLLPLLSAIGYVFSALELIITPLSAILTGINIVWIAVVAALLLVADFVINLWEALNSGLDPLAALIEAFWETWYDIAQLIKTISLGAIDLVDKTREDKHRSTTNTTSTVNTYNIGTVNTKAGLSDLNVSKSRA